MPGFGEALLCACARSEGRDAATWDKGVVKKISGVAVLTATECLPGKGQGEE